MSYKGIIFDLDGTLLDTLLDLTNSFNFALRKFNAPQHTSNDYKLFIGSGAFKCIEQAIPADFRSPEKIQEVLDTFREHYNKNCVNKTKPYSGIIKLLNQLKKNKMKLAVLSNKPHNYTLECVNHYFPDYFNIIYGHHNDFPPKPNPASSLYILNEFGLNKSEMLFIGDTNIDIQTANNAGIKSAGVLWGFRTQKELENNGANYIVSRPEEILNIIIKDN